MPSSISSSDRARRFPSALLLALLGFFACERGLWGDRDFLKAVSRYSPPGPGDSLVTARAALVENRGGPPPVVLLGSSQVREGLDCDLISERLDGRPCVNLGIGAGSPLDVLFLAGRIEKSVPHRISVLGLFPKILHVAPKTVFTNLRTASCLLRSGALLGMSMSERLDVAYGLVESGSETLRNKDALAAAYHAVAGDVRGAWRLRPPAQPQRMLDEEYRQPPSYFRARVGRVDPDQGRPGLLTVAQEDALDALIAFERKAGRTLVILDFPTRPGYETTLAPETRQHYAALLARLRSRRDVVLVGVELLPAFSADDFLDFTHLAESGRRTMSLRLAEIVAALPPR